MAVEVVRRVLAVASVVGAGRGRASWLNAGRLAMHNPTWPEGRTNLSPHACPCVNGLRGRGTRTWH
eukprot:954040-Prymnesium_polylepis.1